MFSQHTLAFQANLDSLKAVNCDLMLDKKTTNQIQIKRAWNKPRQRQRRLQREQSDSTTAQDGKDYKTSWNTQTSMLSKLWRTLLNCATREMNG